MKRVGNNAISITPKKIFRVITSIILNVSHIAMLEKYYLYYALRI